MKPLPAGLAGDILPAVERSIDLLKEKLKQPQDGRMPFRNRERPERDLPANSARLW